MSSASEILCLLNAKSNASFALWILAMTFFLPTSCIEVICVFCFSRNSSISFRKGLLLACRLSLVACGCGFFSKIGSTFLDFFGSVEMVASFGSSVANAYFQIILSCSLNGIAKSLRFRRATRIAGCSSSSISSFFSLSFSCASFSMGFRCSVCSSSFCSWPGIR